MWPRDDQRPVLSALCGLPGSGKSTLGRQIERSTGAVRVNTDEWVADLGVDFFHDEFRQRLQLRLYLLVARLLEVGASVVLEDGLWTRAERDAHRQVAHGLGVAVHLHYFDVPIDALWRRLEQRNAARAHGVVPISKELLQRSQLRFEAPDDTELRLFDRYVVHTAAG